MLEHPSTNHSKRITPNGTGEDAVSTPCPVLTYSTGALICQPLQVLSADANRSYAPLKPSPPACQPRSSWAKKTLGAALSGPPVLLPHEPGSHYHITLSFSPYVRASFASALSSTDPTPLPPCSPSRFIFLYLSLPRLQSSAKFRIQIISSKPARWPPLAGCKCMTSLIYECHAFQREGRNVPLNDIHLPNPINKLIKKLKRSSWRSTGFCESMLAKWNINKNTTCVCVRFFSEKGWDCNWQCELLLICVGCGSRALSIPVSFCHDQIGFKKQAE